MLHASPFDQGLISSPMQLVGGVLHVERDKIETNAWELSKVKELISLHRTGLIKDDDNCGKLPFLQWLRRMMVCMSSRTHQA